MTGFVSGLLAGAGTRGNHSGRVDTRILDVLIPLEMSL